MYNKKGILVEGQVWIKAANSDDDFFMQNIGFENVEVTFSNGDPLSTSAEDTPFVLRSFDTLARGKKTGEVWVRGARGKIAIAISRDDGEIIKILKTYDKQDTPDLSSFSIPQKDANGWSIVEPTLTSKLIYVDSENGNDATAETYSLSTLPGGTWDNPTGIKAFKDPMTAFEQIDNNSNDFMLFKRGQDHLFSRSYFFTKSGKSPTERIAIRDYGVGSRPRLLVDYITPGNNAMLQLWTGGYQNIAVMHLEFYYPKKDPTNPNFVGFGVENYDGGAIQGNAGDGELSGILIEGCKGLYFSHFITFNASDNEHTGTIKNVIIRRNAIGRNYKSISSGGHPQGIYISGYDGATFLLEENYYVRCGYYLAAGTSSPPTLFSHSSYCSALKGAVYLNEVSSNPSSIHVKTTSNSYGNAAEDINTLTDKVKVDFIDPATPESGELGLQAANGDLVLNYVSRDLATNTFTLSEPYNFANNNVQKDAWTQANCVNGEDITCYGSVFIGGEVGFSAGGNEKINLSSYPRYINTKYRKCLELSINDLQIGDRELAWSSDFTDTDGVHVSEILSCGTSNANVTNRRAVAVAGYSANSKVENSISINAGEFSLAETTESSGLIHTTDTSIFVDPKLSILDYIIDNNLGSTYEDFENLMLEQSKDNWDIRLTAPEIQKYFRQKNALKNPVISTKPKPVVCNIGEIAKFQCDAVYNSRVASYQWYRNGVAIVDGSSRTLTITAAATDNKNVFACRVTFEDGSFITSDAVELYVFDAEPKLKLQDPVEVIISVNATTPHTMTAGMGFKLKFRVVSNVQTQRWLDHDSGNYIDVIDSGRNFRIRKNGGSASRVNVSDVNIGDGAIHTLKYKVENTGEYPTFFIDDKPYVGDTLTTGTPIYRVSKLKNSTSYTTGATYVWDLEFFNENDEVIAKFAINSGGVDGSTEDAVEGIGQLILNVDETHWI